jgi:hypothetical protein
MTIINKLTNSSLRKYLPSKVISGFASSIEGLESWMYDDGSNDPWWQGAAGAPVRWVLSADITIASHSSHLTRSPNVYSGLDITPGMWVFSNADPKAVRIVSIISKTDFSIKCVVEDVDRYNTFNDVTISGSGIFPPFSNLIFFTLGDDGLPVLNPLPAGTDIGVVSQVEARFRVFNPTVENRFFQLDHGFKEGQVLRLDKATQKFVHAKSNDIYIAGTVVAVGPGPNYFYLSPSTKVIKDLEPGLPGAAGDVIWLDPVTGDRTTDGTGSLSPLYIKLTNQVPSYTVGSIVNPTTMGGTSVKINNVLITLPGVEPLGLSDIVAEINAKTDNHGVVASAGSSSTVVVGSAPNPSSTPATVLEFKVNGYLVRVQSPSINYGPWGQVGWWDVIRGINEQTDMHGVYATFDTNTGYITFENASGNSIMFENVTPMFTSGDDYSFTDMVGVTEENPASFPLFLKLIRPDGGEITLSNVDGSFTDDMGIQSASNGSLPLALVVDKTMSASTSQMVYDLAAMNALTNVRSGDQVFVQNGVTDGEWELYVRTGNTFTKIADYNSSASDANSLSIEVDFSSTSPVLLGNISDGTRIVDVTIVVSQVFDASGATLSVGVIGQPEAIMSSSIIDLTVSGSYESGTSFMYSGDADGNVYVFLNAAGSTSGKAKIIVSYL